MAHAPLSSGPFFRNLSTLYVTILKCNLVFLQSLVQSVRFLFNLSIGCVKKRKKYARIISWYLEFFFNKAWQYFLESWLMIQASIIYGQTVKKWKGWYLNFLVPRDFFCGKYLHCTTEHFQQSLFCDLLSVKSHGLLAEDPGLNPGGWSIFEKVIGL